MRPPPPPSGTSGLGRLARTVLLAGFGALVCLPLLANITGWQPEAGAGENRVLAPPPPRPHDLATAMAWPAKLSAFIGDHYGLRGLLVGLDGRLRYALFGEFVSDQVTLGRNGRLFFISHSAGAPFSLTERICGTTFTQGQIDAAAAGMAQLLDEGRTVTPRTFYLSIPTTPVIDHPDLPRWLARRCQESKIVVPRMQAALAAQRPDLAARLVYPRAALDDAKAIGLPYPIWNFHWSGLGARAVVQYTGSTVLGLPLARPLADRLVEEPSDLSQFTPGIRHTDAVPFPDHAAAGVEFCYGGGGACGADLAPFGHAINEITRASWKTGSGPSLLIISDSFGRMPAQYFSEYFATVLHLNIAFERLAPGELPALAARIAATGRPDVLLFLLHDAAANDAGGLAGPFAAIAAAFNK